MNLISINSLANTIETREIYDNTHIFTDILYNRGDKKKVLSIPSYEYSGISYSVGSNYQNGPYGFQNIFSYKNANVETHTSEELNKEIFNQAISAGWNARLYVNKFLFRLGLRGNIIHIDSSGSSKGKISKGDGAILNYESDFIINYTLGEGKINFTGFIGAKYSRSSIKTVQSIRTVFTPTANEGISNKYKLWYKNYGVSLNFYFSKTKEFINKLSLYGKTSQRFSGIVKRTGEANDKFNALKILLDIEESDVLYDVGIAWEMKYKAMVFSLNYNASFNDIYDSRSISCRFKFSF